MTIHTSAGRVRVVRAKQDVSERVEWDGHCSLSQWSGSVREDVPDRVVTGPRGAGDSGTAKQAGSTRSTS